MFYDKAKIYVTAGKGGDGSASFRRERYISHGGPDGGDGGRGGSVILRVNPELNTLVTFYHKQHFKADNGGNGRGRKMHGANADNLVVEVPPGTVVRVTEEDILDPTVTTSAEYDLIEPGQELTVAAGGRGGLGNVHFATSVHQAPRIAENGEPGQERVVQLDLKLIADVGLLGYPNAGKSTLLSQISAAKPKIADYPFTTLEPQLGVVALDEQSFVVADIPGLIEGASEGAGLGMEFLRHVERCRLLIHLIDGASGLFPGLTDADLATLSGAALSDREPIADFERINHELAAYSPTLASRPQIVAVNKMDLPEAQKRWPRLRTWFTTHGYPVVAISAATGEGVKDLLRRTASELQELPPRESLAPPPAAPVADDVPTHTLRSDAGEGAFVVTKIEDGFYRVQGTKIERLVNMTRMENQESLDRLQNILEKSGISRALERAGVQAGDTVVIGRAELQWSDDPWAGAEGRRAARRGSRHQGPGKQHS
ncbi:MAG TPA: GTPase ObgE [Chloroflexia bacterium]|nr:GTPase ObgE [Chloroflexia bacterium]